MLTGGGEPVVTVIQVGRGTHSTAGVGEDSPNNSASSVLERWKDPTAVGILKLVMEPVRSMWLSQADVQEPQSRSRDMGREMAGPE